MWLMQGFACFVETALCISPWLKQGALQSDSVKEADLCFLMGQPQVSFQDPLRLFQTKGLVLGLDQIRQLIHRFQVGWLG